MFNLHYELNSIFNIIRANKYLLINLLSALISILISCWLSEYKSLINSIVFLLVFFSISNWMQINKLMFTDINPYSLCKLSLCAILSNLVYLPLLLLMHATHYKVMLINMCMLTFVLLVPRIFASVLNKL